MSTTVKLVCTQCKEYVWIGQNLHIYTGEPKTMELLNAFLFTHKEHPLLFTDEHNDIFDDPAVKEFECQHKDTYDDGERHGKRHCFWCDATLD